MGVPHEKHALTDYSGFVSGVLSTDDWTPSGAHWGRNSPVEFEYWQGGRWTVMGKVADWRAAGIV